MLVEWSVSIAPCLFCVFAIQVWMMMCAGGWAVSRQIARRLS